MQSTHRRVVQPTGAQILFGDAAFGMTEPSDGGGAAAEVRATGVAAKTLLAQRGQSAKKHPLFENMKWDRVGDEQIPAFAPAAELVGNPEGLAGARLVCLTNARQTLRAAATIMRRAKSGDDITLIAYSFDHPTVTSGILDAVYKGAKVSIYQEHSYMCGDAKSK